MSLLTRRIESPTPFPPQKWRCSASSCEFGFRSSREVRAEFWSGMLLRSWSVGLLGVTEWEGRVGEGRIESASDSGGTMDHMHLWEREDRKHGNGDVAESGGTTSVMMHDVCGWGIIVVLARHIGGREKYTRGSVTDHPNSTRLCFTCCHATSRLATI